jgi:hypothetical protein
MSARPTIIIPPALKLLAKEKRWVVWKWIEVRGKDGKPKRTKPPFRADAPSKHASSTDPATWRDLNTAMLAYTEGRADGIGFVLTGSDWTAIDIDGCRNAATDNLHTWAADKIARSHSYAEVTPSNEGIRIIGIATGDKVHRKLSVPNANGMSCELYRKAERYITITGQQIGTTTELANINELIDATLAELGGKGGGRKHDLDSLIKDGCGDDFGGDRSRAVWYVINQLLWQGRSVDDIVAVLLNRDNGISAHIYDQSKPEEYARKQVEKARKEQEEEPDDKAPKRKGADILIELSAGAEELFHAPDGTGYATIPIDDHLETWPVRSKGFRRWLAREYFDGCNSISTQCDRGACALRWR